LFHEKSRVQNGRIRMETPTQSISGRVFADSAF
jgi:hypothetical protein